MNSFSRVSLFLIASICLFACKTISPRATRVSEQTAQTKSTPPESLPKSENQMDVDLQGIDSETTLHKRFFAGFTQVGHCSYYGMNLDALEECLATLPNNTVVTIKHYNQGLAAIASSNPKLKEELDDIFKFVRNERSDVKIKTEL